ncbi:hypothetical protein DYU11_20195 [Fibrisoma montanum]|uniref:Uncharacterized protein n=1 Tax=Fibrisoma montanum TaxID=2305895 RepID=A0A418M3Y6_9BACT|nr:hypothetical protein [Fibrisoma montanum]RIV20374.1 hypothetical protein DYU11_20195 [Fibrisoma montanum]
MTFTREQLEGLSTDDLLILMPVNHDLHKYEDGEWSIGSTLSPFPYRDSASTCISPHRYLVAFLLYCQQNGIELNYLPWLIRQGANEKTP